MPPRKKISGPTPTVKPELTINREEAAEKIKGRIKLGFELQNLPQLIATKKQEIG
jgi:hypothetical protein